VRIKRKNIARLASLSALGAGVLGEAPGTAEAGIVYGVFPTGTVVTADSGGNHTATLHLGGKSLFVHGDYRHPYSSWASWDVKLSGAGFQFRTAYSSSGPLTMVGAGVKWGNAGSGNTGVGWIGGRGWSRNSHMTGTQWGWIPGAPVINPGFWSNSQYYPGGSGGTTGGHSGTITPGHLTHSTTNWVRGNGSFSDRYALFQFANSGDILYGWLEMSNDVSLTSGPTVTLQSWAYDTTGAQIAAGDTQDTGPPPSPPPWP
jgi:hypothetical protein